MKGKGVLIAAFAVLLLILFVPIPKGTFEDGGTREYRALTYKVLVWNKLIAERNDDGSAGETRIYHKTSVFWLPENFKDIDALWEIEMENNP